MLFITLSIYCVFLSLAEVVKGQKAVIEVHVTIDDMVKQHYYVDGVSPAEVKSTIRKDAMFVLAEVNRMYGRLRSHGLDIQLRVTQLDILDKDVFTSADNGNIDVFAGRNEFAAYMKKNNAGVDYDVALLFSGYTFNNNRFDGAAEIDHICQKGAATAVFHGDYRAALIAIHEIGHILGLTHNKDECKDYYVMEAFGNPKSNNKWDFSPCDIEKLKTIVAEKRCLHTTDQASFIPPPDSRPTPGMMDMDRMCKRRGQSYMGKRSYLYGNKIPEGDNVCLDIFCCETSGACRNTDAPNGLVCAEGKRCSYGKCLPAPADNPVPSDVKSGCIFGDANTYKFSCAAHMTGKDKSTECMIPDIATKCCSTCASQGHTTATTPRPSRKNCPRDDHPSCVTRPKDQLCQTDWKDDFCCNYCSDWEEPIVGKRNAINHHLPLGKSTLGEETVIMDVYRGR